jgi:hypothetical protein
MTTDKMEVIADWQAMTTFAWRSAAMPLLALSITNRSFKPLYVSGLWLDARFGISNRYLPMEMLEPRQQVFFTITYDDATTDKIIGLAVNEQLQQLGLKAQMDYLKIMVFTEFCDTTVFEQAQLNLTAAGNALRIVHSSNAVIAQPDWRSFLVPIRITS